jgi:hypothetical protein
MLHVSRRLTDKFKGYVEDNGNRNFQKFKVTHPEWPLFFVFLWLLIFFSISDLVSRDIASITGGSLPPLGAGCMIVPSHILVHAFASNKKDHKLFVIIVP